MSQAHAKSVRSAERLNEDLGVLFARMGTSAHPRGGVLVAYRNALRALATALDAGQMERAWQVAEVLKSLRREVLETTKPIIKDSATAAAHTAVVQLEAYGIDAGGRPTDTIALSVIDQAMLAITATLDAQIAGAQAMAATGASKALIIGDEDRQGVLIPVAITAAAAFWAVRAASTTWDWIATNWGGTRQTFYKQAIAAIDERTTDCCLEVHGQVQPMDEPFKLTGTPRYADELDEPPFHWNCRTAMALVTPDDADDQLSQEMRDAARAESNVRETTGRRDEIHPADARSRR